MGKHLAEVDRHLAEVGKIHLVAVVAAKDSLDKVLDLGLMGTIIVD